MLGLSWWASAKRWPDVRRSLGRQRSPGSRCREGTVHGERDTVLSRQSNDLAAFEPSVQECLADTQMPLDLGCIGKRSSLARNGNSSSRSVEPSSGLTNGPTPFPTSGARGRRRPQNSCASRLPPHSVETVPQ